MLTVVVVLRKVGRRPEELDYALTVFLTVIPNHRRWRKVELEISLCCNVKRDPVGVINAGLTIGGRWARDGAEVVERLEERADNFTRATNSRVNERDVCGSTVRSGAVNVHRHRFARSNFLDIRRRLIFEELHAFVRHFALAESNTCTHHATAKRQLTARVHGLLFLDMTRFVALDRVERRLTTLLEKSVARLTNRRASDPGMAKRRR